MNFTSSGNWPGLRLLSLSRKNGDLAGHVAFYIVLNTLCHLVPLFWLSLFQPCLMHPLVADVWTPHFPATVYFLRLLALAVVILGLLVAMITRFLMPSDMRNCDQAVIGVTGFIAALPLFNLLFPGLSAGLVLTALCGGFVVHVRYRYFSGVLMADVLMVAALVLPVVYSVCLYGLGAAFTVSGIFFGLYIGFVLVAGGLFRDLDSLWDHRHGRCACFSEHV